MEKGRFQEFIPKVTRKCRELVIIGTIEGVVGHKAKVRTKACIKVERMTMGAATAVYFTILCDTWKKADFKNFFTAKNFFTSKCGRLDLVGTIEWFHGYKVQVRTKALR